MMDPKLHFLLITFPAQGHINPALQFAKRLIRIGSQVTFVTTVFAHRRMLTNSTPLPDGLTYAPFSDGYDEGFRRADHDANNFLSEFRRRSTEALINLVRGFAKQGLPVTCLIHGLGIPWALDVAHDLHLPSTLLWAQPATVFDIYYYYFNGYRDVIAATNNDPSYMIKLPGLPSLTCHDIPSFLLPSDTYPFHLERFKEQFKMLERETERRTKLRVLVNTFDALESEALTILDKVNLIGIGPLIPSAFLDCKDPSDTSFGGDIFNGSKNNYIEWLNSQQESSVVYISFGTIAVIANNQMEEIRRALVKTRRSFLWAIRADDGRGQEGIQLEEEEQQLGLIVPWCSQVEVLSHPSVGCFVTHCGWNSTLESLVVGVPVVAFPQWTDQGTNAKLIEDVWRTGVRVKVNEDKIVESGELKRCLEIVMGDGVGEEMRMNAKKWKDLAKKAVEEGGSSDRNLHSFVEEVGREC